LINSSQLYTHSEAAQASGLVRRRYTEAALTEEEAAKAILCTGGKQACLIAEGSDAFEVSRPRSFVRLVRGRPARELAFI